jgi:hypothetical protein
MSVGKRRAVSLAALAFGAILFAGTLYYVDIDMALATGRRLGRALSLAPHAHLGVVVVFPAAATGGVRPAPADPPRG